MEMQVKFNLGKTVKSLSKLQRKITKRIPIAINAAAEQGITIIKTRTAKGRDYKGKAFAKYSPGYARQRLARGSQLTPNLIWSGDMLRNINRKKISNTAFKLFFPNPDQNEKASFHNFTGVGKKRVKRVFFKLSKKEEERLRKTFRQSMKKAIRL